MSIALQNQLSAALPITEPITMTSHGRKHAVQVYHLEKRDSFVVVAQLSPKFTARLVDCAARRKGRHLTSPFGEGQSSARPPRRSGQGLSS